ncbi:hypothetical protein [Streptomyces sp. NPDC003036]|uniref:hypothetical protein n=1 Tax=Streptomyces sp. NPDC003036 TaxID=3154442 RepID=UPI0033B54728
MRRLLLDPEARTEVLIAVGDARFTTCLAEPVTAPGARLNLSVFTPGEPVTC